MPVEPTTPHDEKGLPTRLPPRRFVAVVSALGGIQLLAMMDGTVAIFALPKIQNELGLSDATRSWVITAYVLTSGGLMLLGGRIGDTIGHKRTLIVGAALFTITSAMCGVAWDGGVLVLARLLQGRGRRHRRTDRVWRWWRPRSRRGRSATPRWRCSARWPVSGPWLGLVAGGALTEVSWRLAFLVNVPIGLLVIYLARTALRETEKERMKLDASRGRLLATIGLHRSGFRLLDGSGERLAVGHHPRFGSGGSGQLS